MDEITEQRIGVAVFNRSEKYDPNEDNIVRSYARKLRKRIDEYFATEGSRETLRLDIPRGGYTPHFYDHAIAPRVTEVDPRPAPVENKPQQVEINKLTVPRKLRIGFPAISNASHGLTRHLHVSPGMLLSLLIGIL